jgi:hypothetical protein
MPCSAHARVIACGGASQAASQPARRREMPSLGLEASPQLHPGTSQPTNQPSYTGRRRTARRRTRVSASAPAATVARTSLGRRARQPAATPAPARHPAFPPRAESESQNPQAHARNRSPGRAGPPTPRCRARTGRRGDRGFNANRDSADRRAAVSPRKPGGLPV